MSGSPINKNVSMKEIAEQAGVSKVTVSLALRDSPRISKNTKDKIQKIAEELDYRPNYMAKGLAGQKTDSVGIIVPRLRDLFYVNVISSQQRYLSSKGRISLLEVTNAEDEIFKIDNLVNRGVDGLILNYLPLSAKVRERIADIARGGMPVSILAFECIEHEGIDTVYCDESKSSYELTSHLLELGHTRIALTSPGTHDRRIHGYKKALAEKGLQYDPKLHFSLKYIYQDISQMRKDLMSLRDRPTAVLAYNDDLAAELIGELIEEGYSVPEEVSVVGINDTWYSKLIKVSLTTFRMPMQEIGELLVDQLLKRIETPGAPSQCAVIDGELVIRDSTAPPQKVNDSKLSFESDGSVKPELTTTI